MVRRPASRRVAELVGYLSFVPYPAGGAGAVAGVHPERVVPGAHPGRGLVLSGPVRDAAPGRGRLGGRPGGRAGAWSGAGCPTRPGAEATVTVLDPPCFGADGMLLPRSTQVSA